MQSKKSQIPKEIIRLVVSYIASKLQNHSNQDKDFKWRYFIERYTPIIKFLCFIKSNKLPENREAFEKFKEHLTEMEERSVNIVVGWQSVIYEFLKDNGNGEISVNENLNVEDSPSAALSSDLNRSEVTTMDDVIAPEIINQKEIRSGNIEQNLDILPNPPSKGGIAVIDVKPHQVKKFESDDMDICQYRDENFDQAIQSFFMSLNNKHTARAYVRHIKEFFDIFSHIHPSEVTVNMINLYIRRLKELDNSISTIKSKLSALSKLYNFLTKPLGASISPVVKFNPFQNIIMPKVQMYGNAKKIDLETAWMILNEIDQNEIIGARDYAFYLWLLLTGRRMDEIRILRKSDLSFRGEKKIFYTFQPEKDRFDYSKQDELLPPPVWKAIVHYWTISEREIGEDSPIFLSASNNGKKGNEPLSDTAFRVDLKIYCSMAGIDISEVDPHSFRHCHAHVLLQMGVDLKRIQEKLGHKNIATTQVYLQSISTPEETFWEGIMKKLNEESEPGDNADTETKPNPVTFKLAS